MHKKSNKLRSKANRTHKCIFRWPSSKCLCFGYRTEIYRFMIAIPSSGFSVRHDRRRGREAADISVAWRWCQAPPSNKSRSLSVATQTVTENPEESRSRRELLQDPARIFFPKNFNSHHFDDKPLWRIVSVRGEFNTFRVSNSINIFFGSPCMHLLVSRGKLLKAATTWQDGDKWDIFVSRV